MSPKLYEKTLFVVDWAFKNIMNRVVIVTNPTAMLIPPS